MKKHLLPLLCVLLPGVALAGATASVFKKETRLGTNYWNAQSAIDGKNETAWMVPGESENVNEWIKLDLPKATIDKIGMMPGFARDADTFSDYARVKSVHIEAFCCLGDNPMNSSGSATATFEDKMEFQIVDIDDITLGNDLFGGKVKITVTEVYDGVDFPSVAMSEVVVYLTEFDAAAAISADSGDDPEHMAGEMQDDNARTYWTSAPDGAQFTFAAEGYGLASIGLQAGPASHARPKTVKVVANDREIVQELANSGDMQFIEIPPVVGYSGSAWGDITVEITEVYPGSSASALAIAEFKTKATNYEGL